MNPWVILVEMAAFAAIFTAVIFAYYRGDRKHSPASIHNYPPDIQAEYFKTHERVDVSYKSKNVLLTKGFGVLLFTGILLVCARVAGAKTFWQGFGLTFGLMAWIGIYDTCFFGLGAVRQPAHVPAGGHGAHGCGLPSEVVPREGNAVSRHRLCADPRCAGGYTGDADAVRGIPHEPFIPHTTPKRRCGRQSAR